LQQFISRTISFIIIFQLSFIFQIQNSYAGVGKKLQGTAKKKINKLACKGGGSNIGSEFGCKGLDIITSDPNFLKEVVNMVLIMTMSLTLINSKCEKTEAGKTLKPKSITAGITHWIHKISSLIYIFAELQNVITLRRLDSKLSKKAKEKGQTIKYQTLLKIQKAKLAASEKKQKILDISTLGLGASSAVELGMSAAYGGWGTYLKYQETAECAAKEIDISSCAIPGGASATVTSTVAASTTVVSSKCSIESLKEEMSASLIKTAKNTVMKKVVTGITTVVGGVIGKKVTEKAGGGKVAQVGGAAVGAVVASKVAKKVVEMVASDGDSKTMDLKQIVKECVEKRAKKIVKTKAKQIAAAAAHNICTPFTCAATAAASCAAAIATLKEECGCAMRNVKDLPDTIKQIGKNVKLPEKVVDNDALAINLARHISSDKSLSRKGVKEKEETCGVDYTDWLTRHDLECKSRFDFLSDEEKGEKPEENPVESKAGTEADVGDKNNTDNKDTALGTENTNEKVLGQEGDPTEVDNSEGKSSVHTESKFTSGKSVGELSGSAAGMMAEEDALKQQQGNSGVNDNLISTEKQEKLDPVEVETNSSESQNYENGIDNCTETINADGTINPATGSGCSSGIFNQLEKILGKEVSIFKRLTSTKTMDIHQGLKSNDADKWAKMLLNDPSLIQEYNGLNGAEKTKMNKAFSILTEAIIHLQSSIFPVAHAEGANEFVSSTKEASVLGGLGVTAIGMLIFPEFIKKGMQLTTVLQRNPLRRGIFYLATYFMAKENSKSNKKRIKGIRTNIKSIEEVMQQDGIPLEEEKSATSFIPGFIKNNLQVFPNVFAANMIDENLVPLCIDGDYFTTKCTCASTNSCGNAITRVNKRSTLFQIPAFAKSTRAQLSFVRKMAAGKATGDDFTSLHNSLRSYSKDLDPEIAANNIDFVLVDSGLPKFNIVKRSKNLMAALQKKGVSQLLEKSGSKLDITKFDFNTEVIVDLEKKSQNITETTPKARKKKNSKIIDNMKISVKAGKKAENLGDFVLKTGDINPNTEHDLFKIINNRYKRVWLNNDLEKNNN
jgi:hypothetical protein